MGNDNKLKKLMELKRKLEILYTCRCEKGENIELVRKDLSELYKKEMNKIL